MGLMLQAFRIPNYSRSGWGFKAVKSRHVETVWSDFRMRTRKTPVKTTLAEDTLESLWWHAQSHKADFHPKLYNPIGKSGMRVC